ncbi:MAG: TetR family transcriptional regulator [Desulfococcus sp. 4484_241]|nr:MAG: TetR family transcriptional regulator [Desulfococcus sp. 4484_241]
MEQHPNREDDTKTRLLMAAGEVFAERGYRSATVREICRRADANIGAINYHFRDKKGLYRKVLEYSLRLAIKKYPPDMNLKKGTGPEEKLRAFIRSFLLRMMADGLPAWHGKLMAQEIANPTSLIKQVIKRSIRPLNDYLEKTVCELMEKEGIHKKPGDYEPFVCAMSIIGQCIHYFKGRPMIQALCPEGFDDSDIDMLTDHITNFSIGGIRAVTGKKRSPKIS